MFRTFSMRTIFLGNIYRNYSSVIIQPITDTSAACIYYSPNYRLSELRATVYIRINL